MKPVVYICIAGLSLALALMAVVVGQRMAVWIRYSCAFIGVVSFAAALLRAALEYYRPTLAYPTRAYLDHYATLLSGAAIGAIVVLCFYVIAGLFKKLSDSG